MKNFFDAIVVASNEALELIPFTKGGIVSIMGPPTPKMLNKVVESMGDDAVYMSGFIRNLLYYAPSILNWMIGGSKAQNAASSHGAHYEFLLTLPTSTDLDAITEYIEAGKITPVIDSVHSFENWRDAVTKMNSGRATGKVVINVAGSDVTSQ